MEVDGSAQPLHRFRWLVPSAPLTWFAFAYWRTFMQFLPVTTPLEDTPSVHEWPFGCMSLLTPAAGNLMGQRGIFVGESSHSLVLHRGDPWLVAV